MPYVSFQLSFQLSLQQGRNMKIFDIGLKMASVMVVAVALVVVPLHEARADSGFYVGGSLGQSTIEADFSGTFDDFDEDEFSWKAYGGYNFDLVFIDLAVEAGYVDFGSPSSNNIDLDVDGWDVFALAGVELGPIGLFAKAGMIAWDAEASFGPFRESDDGTDPAYGVGARFSLGSFEIRGEYEYFDVDSADDVYLLSAGLVWTF
jgi:hypothetical protein